MSEYIIACDEETALWVANDVDSMKPIVRCRDCKHFAVDQSDHEYRSGWWCARWSTDMVKPDGFCAWGERKEGSK